MAELIFTSSFALTARAGGAGWPVVENWTMRFNYRSLALMCLRGRFEVRDPAQVADLALTLNFRGGAVIYLNGKEVGMPRAVRRQLAVA